MNARATEPRMRRVLVVQRRLTHYRVPFFQCLRRVLADDGLELVLAHGQGTPDEDSKNDLGELDWAVRLATRYFAGGRLCWQPFERLARDCELVVVTHENKLLCNLSEQFFSRSRRVALWGHGANLQGQPGSLRERFKRYVAGQADWWLAYTQFSVPLIERSGFPADRITVLNNSIDTSTLREQHERVDPARLARLRAEIGLGGGPVGIYVGSLYPDKRLPFLFAALRRVRERVPGFEMLIAGSGPEADAVRAFCAANTWAHYLGPRMGQDKADTMALADVMLNPGLVGLGILDSFVCEVPMITTDCGLHSPEIAYLDSGRNGIMTPDDEDAFVQAAVDVLQDAELRERLKAGCAASGEAYTIEQMAQRFRAGVNAALSAPIHRFTREA